MSSFGLSVGIVGLPNVGKSTLFNALLKKRVALSANYPFTTVEPNVGIVAVPDERLQKLAQLVQKEEKMENPPPIVPAVVEFIDIAGLVKDAHIGAGLGNQFLAHIREVDTIVHVLRDFVDFNVIRAGSENPDADKLTIEVELGLADLQTIEKLIVNQEKVAKVSKDVIEARKLEILNQIKVELEQGKVLGVYQIADNRLKDWFEHLPLLSIKPVLYVYNISEEKYMQKAHDREESVSGDEVVICAKLEEELVDLSDEEKVSYLNELGIEQTGLERLTIKAYNLLGLISFFTTKEGKEVRAWSVRLGTQAPQAAGVVHTDFERGFIKALVIDYDKLIEASSFAEAKNRGWLRTEGREYIVQDGDVIAFLVNT